MHPRKKLGLNSENDKDLHAGDEDAKRWPAMKSCSSLSQPALRKEGFLFVFGPGATNRYEILAKQNMMCVCRI